MLEGTLPKFSLMDPDEFDAIEHLQQTVFRPDSFNRVKETAQTLLSDLQSGKRLKGEEKALDIRLTNLIKSNVELQSLTKEDYLNDVIEGKSPGAKLATARLMKDTNKGISNLDELMNFLFTDGSKATEKLAKHRLITDFNIDPNDFLLLPDAGPDAIFVDEDTKEVRRKADIKIKKNRSVDAITELDDKVIVWCMKYKGGTAAVGGSGQSDQGTSEGKEMSKMFEATHKKGKEITYKGKPVFFANLVYGAQFNDPKRIVENELAFRTEYRCYRSFNISISQVANVINTFKLNKDSLDNLMESVYNKYGYDIYYRGNAKGTTKQRLTEWIK